jgi:DNA-binding transcriptional MerR regulator
VYRIGEFARIGSVSRKTLRFYDEIGLLKPSMTDPLTRYRYYAPRQLRVLAEITTLKDMGLSLSEIALLGRRASRRVTLERARARLAHAVSRAQASLDRLDAALAGTSDLLPVVVKQRPTICVASLGAITVGYDDVVLAERELLLRVPERVRGRVRGVLWHQCADAGSPCGEPFIELRSPLRMDRTLDIKELPAITAACAYADDEYDAAERAYYVLRNWMSVQQHTLAGPKRELYHDGTLEIQFPLGM